MILKIGKVHFNIFWGKMDRLEWLWVFISLLAGIQTSILPFYFTQDIPWLRKIFMVIFTLIIYIKHRNSFRSYMIKRRKAKLRQKKIKAKEVKIDYGEKGL